jgi:hypothetical protein
MRALCVLAPLAGACSAPSRPVTVPASAAPRPTHDALLDKLEPHLRARYIGWRAHHGPRERVEAEGIVRRWTCRDASYDERRGVSRCADARGPTRAEYAQVEAARLVLDPRVHVAVWLESEQAARDLEAAGVHLWSSRRQRAIQPVLSTDLNRIVYEVRIFPLALEQMERLLARPGVLHVRSQPLDAVDPPHDLMGR